MKSGRARKRRAVKKRGSWAESGVTPGSVDAAFELLFDSARGAISPKRDHTARDSRPLPIFFFVLVGRRRTGSNPHRLGR